MDAQTWVLAASLFVAFAFAAVRATRKNKLIKFLLYAPVALLVCCLPALNFWGWHYIIHSSDGTAPWFVTEDSIVTLSDPAWYGIHWMQSLAITLLGGAGFLLDRWINRD